MRLSDGPLLFYIEILKINQIYPACNSRITKNTDFYPKLSGFAAKIRKILYAEYLNFNINEAC